MPWPLARLPAIYLEAIALGVDGEGRVIVVAVIGAQPGLPVIATAGGKRRLMEGIDALAGGRVEAEMQTRCRIGFDRALAMDDPQHHAILSVAERGVAAAEPRITERLQRGIVERLRL